MQNGAVNRAKLDPRCCLIEWLRDPCDAEANSLAKSRVEFTAVSQKPTDLWATLSTSEGKSGLWNFEGGPSCLVQKDLQRGDAVALRFPPGWSGNTFATKAGWVNTQAGHQVKWGGAAHSILFEYTFGCTACPDPTSDTEYWWDLSAIPNAEPGQCVSAGLLHRSCHAQPSQCDPRLSKSVVVYGNNDAECRGKAGQPQDPGGWYKWQNDKAIAGNWSLVPSWGADHRTPTAGHGYRFNWFGEPACYNYDDCKAKVGPRGHGRMTHPSSFYVLCLDSAVCAFGDECRLHVSVG